MRVCVSVHVLMCAVRLLSRGQCDTDENCSTSYYFVLAKYVGALNDRITHRNERATASVYLAGFCVEERRRLRSWQTLAYLCMNAR